MVPTAGRARSSPSRACAGGGGGEEDEGDGGREQHAHDDDLQHTPGPKAARDDREGLSRSGCGLVGRVPRCSLGLPLGGAARRRARARRRHGVPRVGAAGARARARARRRAHPARAAGLRRATRSRRPPRRDRTTPTSSTACACPTRAAAGSPTACAGRRACSTPARSPGPTPAGSRRRCATSCSTSCTSARSRPRGRSTPRSAHLPALRELGVTAIELMPVAEFPGRHGWGYDGVYLSAAHSAYGGPLGLQRLVDAAHAAGLAVILDVVYNHLGASGVQAMEAFGPYLTDRYAHAVGQGRQPRRRAVGPGARVDPAVGGAAGSATSTSTGCGSTRSTRCSTPTPSTSSPRSPAACTRRTRARS